MKRTLTVILFASTMGGGQSLAKDFAWFFRNVPPSGQCGGAQEIAASFYYHGRRTANGEAFDANGNTAASRTLPFGHRVRLTNPKTGRSVTVRINDRGPYGQAHALGVKLDLARGAARRLGMTQTQWLCAEFQEAER